MELSGQTFGKYPNIKCHENPPSGTRDVPYGKTDRRTCRT